jgi:hypothetical protein
MAKEVRTKLDIVKPPERGDIDCQEEETALCVIGERRKIYHTNVTCKRANKHCLTKKKIITAI